MHVTVIMSSFNEEDTIAAAVESIRAQTFSDWDLVVVDDASTDGTGGILSALQGEDSRIRVLTQDRNRGLARSLNRVLDEARGDLIARMDGDDVSMPERLERQVNYMESNEAVDVLGSAAELIDGDGVSRGTARRPSDHEELVRRFPRENPFIHPSVMIRRRFFERVGRYSETLRRAQDLELWARGLASSRYHNLQEPLIRYRIPQRPSLAALGYGSYVVFRAGRLSGKPLSAAWYSARFLASGFAMRIGIRDPWTK